MKDCWHLGRIFFLFYLEKQAIFFQYSDITSLFLNPAYNKKEGGREV